MGIEFGKNSKWLKSIAYAKHFEVDLRIIENEKYGFLVFIRYLILLLITFSRAGASKCENENKMEKYSLLANQQCIEMIVALID